MEAHIVIANNENGEYVEIVLNNHEVILKNHEGTTFRLPDALFCPFVKALKAAHDALHAAQFIDLISGGQADLSETFEQYFSENYGDTGGPDVNLN